MINLKEIDIDYSFQGNILKKLMIERGCPLTLTVGNVSVTFTTYIEFLEMWEDDTGIPCWDCGRELFRLKGTNELLCLGGKILGKV